MITEYPAYLQKTDIDGLKQFVPAGETFYTVVFKEMIDNALDAAEKTDNTVNIVTKDDYVFIKNKGFIPDRILKNILRPDINASSKYRQYSFKRGAIGQGLRLAVAIATLNGKDFFIKTNNKCLTISAVDRLSFDTDNIFSIIEKGIDGFNDITEISFYAPKLELQDMVLNYILVNPHITFFLNGTEYSRRAGIDKSLKNDISKYEVDDINKLCKFYSLPDIINSFNISNSHKKETLKSLDFAGLLKKYAKPVKPPVFSIKPIENRLKEFNIEITAYKKIELTDGILELVITDTDYPIISINESVLNDGRLWIYDEKRNMQVVMGRLLSDIKFKAGLMLFYHCSKPEFQDANKQAVIINTSEQEFNKIKNFLKTYNGDKRTAHDGWHLCFDKDELTQKIVLIANKMYESMNLPITVRQLYYQLVSQGVIKNGKYNTLDAYLTDLRKKDILDWELFEDRNRYFHKINTIKPATDMKDLVSSYITNLKLPPIDKWHGQDYYIELWYEKDALSSYFQHIADKWHILCFANRGYNSFTMNKETQNRLAENKDKNIVILYAGDYDPHGFVIYENLKKVLNVKIERIALTKEQIEQYNLIEMPDLKGVEKIKNDFTRLYGNKAYELDALPPTVLMNLLGSSISKYFDPDKYDRSVDIKNQAKLEIIKRTILDSLK